MASAIVICIALSTLAFGAVYPWGFVPLFAAALALGIWGIARSRTVVADCRVLAIVFGLCALAVGLQLLPVSRDTLLALSPSAVRLLDQYSLNYATGTLRHPLSIVPESTLLALLAFVSFAIYVVGLPGSLSGSTLRRIPSQLIVFGVALAIFSIFQHQRANGLVYWFWQPQEGSGSNAFGPFVNRNHFAGWMVMSLSLAIGYWLGTAESIARHLTPSWHGRALWLSSTEGNRFLATTTVVVIMAVALVWPLSRSGIVSFCIALACFAVAIATRTHMGGRRRLLAAVAVVLLASAALVWRGPTRLVGWFSDTRDLQSRLAAWQDGLRVFADFQTTGTGLNTYGTSMLFYQKSNPNFHLGSAHNDYLQLLTEGGLLVAVPAAIAILVLAYGVRRNVQAARPEIRGYWIRVGAAVGLIAIGVQELAEFSLQIPANAFLFSTLAAIALAPASKPGRAKTL